MIHNTIKCEDNTYRCTHIDDDVRTTYYPNPNPNHKKGAKCGARNLNPNPKAKILLLGNLGKGFGPYI